jgi:two-component system, sensor histidine kinase FlrB
MPECWPQPLVAAPVPALAEPGSPSSGAAAEDEQFLLRAFRSFAEAAGSLEHSYGLLRLEVERLRRELETSHSDLARSLEANRGMRIHLDCILEGLPCGVLVASPTGEISRANPEARRLLGIQPDGKIDSPADVADLGSIALLPGAVRQLLDEARQREGEPELAIPDGQGAVRWLAARHASLPDRSSPDRSSLYPSSPDGTANSSVFILRDVSQRKRLEAAQARLGREQALAEMSAVLAHEIRNPIASLELFAGLLADSALEPEPRSWVEQVQTGLRSLGATVHNVLHFHSLPEPERAPVDLGQLLDWARDFFAPLARQAGIVLSSQNRLHGVFFAADRHRLEQVLVNLVLNAIRAMPGGGWIELGGRALRNGKEVSIRVADTGPGVSAEHLPSIFEPGYSTRAGSPGLGLAVCRKIVEQHGGEISAASPPGQGAAFTLTFPLASGPGIAGPLVSCPLTSGPLTSDPLISGPARGAVE